MIVFSLFDLEKNEPRLLFSNPILYETPALPATKIVLGPATKDVKMILGRQQTPVTHPAPVSRKRKDDPQDV